METRKTDRRKTGSPTLQPGGGTTKIPPRPNGERFYMAEVGNLTRVKNVNLPRVSRIGDIPTQEAYPLPAPAVYEHLAQTYWRPAANGEWIKENETNLLAYFKDRASFNLTKEEKAELQTIADVEKRQKRQAVMIAEKLKGVIVRMHDHYSVSYAGSLAGRNAGFYEENGSKIVSLRASPASADGQGEAVRTAIRRASSQEGATSRSGMTGLKSMADAGTLIPCYSQNS